MQCRIGVQSLENGSEMIDPLPDAALIGDQVLPDLDQRMGNAPAHAVAEHGVAGRNQAGDSGATRIAVANHRKHGR